eukprot:TRINITY_DN77282_c0_g1_i1.p1 TRINITY_DN77282_c0_g1~~TRINITY_DN77282_c0_g1_i1.p1  ORF type:complete len:181 (-),score=10.43 TRINITY_DN77282_c0_g1_i1:42-584(-)
MELLGQLNTKLDNFEGTGDAPVSLLGGRLWVCAADEVLALVEKHNITNVVNAAGVVERSDWFTEKKEQQPHVNYLEVESDDCSEFEILVKHFEKADKFITDAMQSGGKVLIHCWAGCSRSVTLCIAYLIAHENMELLDCVDLIQNQRTGILATEGFRHQLVQFQLRQWSLQQTTSPSHCC